jgi:hypothetical protein
LEFYDVAAVDTIVEKLDKDNARFSTLLMGIVESAPFQKRRNVTATTASAETKQENLAAKD